jgi:hypothetical protein
MKLLILQLSPTSSYFVPLGYQYSHRLLSNTLRLCSLQRKTSFVSSVRKRYICIHIIGSLKASALDAVEFVTSTQWLPDPSDVNPLRRIVGSHTSGYKEFCLLGYNAV